jgi:BASS family bile acid:Na+ symporter
VRRFWPRFADRMDKPVRIASVIILVVVIAGAVASNWALLIENFARLALITIVFCLLSLALGYLAPRWL